MRSGVERRARELVRQSMPFLVPAHRRYVEWSYATRTRSRERLFTRIYQSNHWGDPGSVSGGGSNLEQTAALRATLPRVLRTLGVRSLLDAPCGDFHWMRQLDLELERYVGGDCLVHFSFRQIDAAVRNFRRSGAVYLLTTTFTDRQSNRDIVTGDWRALNPCAPPLRWPQPLLLINEGCTQSGSMFADKSLGIWELASLPSGRPL